MEIHLAAVVTLDRLTRGDSSQGEVTEPRDVEESDIGGKKNGKSEEFSPSCKLAQTTLKTRFLQYGAPFSTL